MKTAYNWLRDKLKSEGKSYAFTDAEEVYIAQAMEEHARERAEGFAEWAATGYFNCHKKDGGNYWIKDKDAGIDQAERFTTDELYALYLTSTGQQSENKTEQL